MSFEMLEWIDRYDTPSAEMVLMHRSMDPVVVDPTTCPKGNRHTNSTDICICAEEEKQTKSLLKFRM